MLAYNLWGIVLLVLPIMARPEVHAAKGGFSPSPLEFMTDIVDETPISSPPQTGNHRNCQKSLPTPCKRSLQTSD
jgi:hypothetical protein